MQESLKVLDEVRLIFSTGGILMHNITLAFIVIGVALASGSLFSAAFRCKKAERRTIAIETGIQNSGLAVALLFNPIIFPFDLDNGGMAFIAAWWTI